MVWGSIYDMMVCQHKPPSLTGMPGCSMCDRMVCQRKTPSLTGMAGWSMCDMMVLHNFACKSFQAI